MNSLPSCLVTAWSAAHEKGRIARPRLDAVPHPDTRSEAPNRAVELLRGVLEPIRAELRSRIERYDPQRIGIFLGSSTGGIDRTERAYLEYVTRGTMPETYSLEMSHSHHSLIEEIRSALPISGPSYVVSTACSSTAKALGAAQRWLALGLLDAAIVGGADSKTALTQNGFRSLNLIDPEGCRPFDATRRGLELGEGAAILLLERESTGPGPALHLRAVGESNDAYDLTAPDPEGHGAELAMRRALDIAELSPHQIDYINAHGTGTKQNDLSETRALSKVFGNHVAFSSTKNTTGHLLGTAGAMEAVLCLEALLEQSAPQNLKPQAQDAALACQPMLERTERPLNAVLSNSFAFGGSNASVLLANAPGTKTAEFQRTRIYLLSARHIIGSEGVSGTLPSILPARVRSRASPLTRTVAGLFAELTGANCPTDISLVLGSAFGEMSTTMALLGQLALEDQLSPLRFPGSVHNAAVGILTQLTHNRGYATALAAGVDTVAATLADALVYLRCHGGEALALVADEEGPRALLGGETFPRAGVGFRFATNVDPQQNAWAVVEGIERVAEVQDPVIPESLRPHSSPEAGPIEHAPAAFGLDLANQVMSQSRLERATTFPVGPLWRLRLAPVAPKTA